MPEKSNRSDKSFLEGNSISPNELQIQYGIPSQEIASFRNLIQIYPDREVIIKEGDHENALYLLRIGTVEVFKGKGSKQELIGTIEAVNFIGEMSMINDEPRSATVISQTNNVVVYRIPNPNIHTILTNPKWAELLISRLSKNLAKSLDQQIVLSEQVKELRSELDTLKVDTKNQQQQASKNLRLAINGILYFQGVVQQSAVVGSKGWAYLNALTHVTRTLIARYITNLDESDKSVEVNVIRECLVTLPQDVQTKINDDISQLL